MNNAMTRFEALNACRDAAGTDSQLARDLGVPQSTMWRMIHSSKQLRSDLVLTAEEMYGVSRHDLRPDYYPREEIANHGTADRFCGIDQQVSARQHMAAPNTDSKAA